MSASSELIFDLNGEPFRDFHRAAALRDLLVRETGQGYRVDRGVEDDEYIVRRVPIGVSVPGNRRLEDRIEVDQPDVSSTNSEFTPMVLRPALRTSLPFYLPFIMLGGFLVANPVLSLSFLMSIAGIDSLPRFVKPEWLIVGIRVVGAFLCFPSIRHVVHPWLSSRYRLSKDGVSMEHGIIARDVVQVRYRDIRSTSVSQGIFERLLNVGTVQFFSAGDEVDVSFTGIPGPAQVRRLVQRLINDTGNR